MKKFTSFTAALILAAFTIQAQLDVGTGLYEFADEADLWKNTATGTGTGTIMCEGVMQYFLDAHHSDTTGVLDTDYSVIDGVNDKAIALKAHNWLKIWHGIPVNGGGTWVNDWTVVMDVRVADANGIYSLHEVNYNASESGYSSELEIADMKLGTVEGAVASGEGIPYSETTLEVDKWYRITYAAKLSEFIKVYVDGLLVTEITGNWVDGRPAPYDADTRGDRSAFKVGGNNETIDNNDPPRDGDKDIDLVAVFGATLNDTEIFILGAADDGSSSIQNLMSTINHFRCYPNPASDILNIQVNDVAQVQLINAVGQIVKDQNVEGNASLDISNLQQGVYLVRVSDSKATTTKKIVVE